MKDFILWVRILFIIKFKLVITIATVGFGDIAPVTDPGKLFVMLLIIYTVVVFIPMQTNELLRLMSLKSFFARKIYK